jgi:putative DNA primase/helicase
VLAVNPENIREELPHFNSWVGWKAEQRKGQLTKVPYQISGANADVSDPSTFAPFRQTLEAYQNGDGWNGIGIVLTKDKPLVGIDLDKCRDPETGQIESWALEEIRALNTYAEISPSGTGVRMFTFAKLPDTGRKNGRVEVYDSGRFLTVTEHHIEGTPCSVETRQKEVDEFHSRYFSEKEKTPGEPKKAVQFTMGDSDIFVIAQSASNANEFLALYSGE